IRLCVLLKSGGRVQHGPGFRRRRRATRALSEYRHPPGRNQCSSGFCHSHLCGTMLIRGQSRFIGWKSVPGKQCSFGGPPSHETLNDLATRVNPEPELHHGAVELTLVDITQQAGAQKASAPRVVAEIDQSIELIL